MNDPAPRRRGRAQRRLGAGARARPRTGRAPAPSLDSDGDGYADNLDCSPQDPKVHLGAPDLPDPQFVDSNRDGIDGTAAEAIFVSPIGDDANRGTETAPKRTFAAAVPRRLALRAGEQVPAPRR